MAEFEESLQALLSNEDLMGQILSLAKNLGGNTQGDAQGAQEQASETKASDDNATGGFPPLGDLLGSLGGGLDPAMLSMVMQLVAAYREDGQDDKNVTLISALRPFLKEKRQAKVDQAISYAKLIRVARVALKGMKGGGLFV